MSAIVPFNFTAPAANLAVRRENSKNALLMTNSGPSFPVLSIRGKVFALVKDSTRKPLTRRLQAEDGTVEEVPLSTLSLAVVHGNPRARVFYAKGYTEGESDGQKPTCFSYDGQKPDAGSEAAQAKNCQVCPHSKWGSKVRADSDGEAKGTACAPRTRLAVTDPSQPKVPFLLDLPPASRANFNDAIKLVETHGRDFDEVAFKVSFDMAAATPKLIFAPYGLLTDEVREVISTMAADPVVAEICGVANPLPDDAAPATTPAPAAPAPPAPKAPSVSPPPVTDDELNGALSGAATEATAAVRKAAAKAKAADAPKPAEKPKAAPAPAPSGDGDLGSLLGGLKDLLNTPDD